MITSRLYRRVVSKRAFTLIELMIGTSLSGFVMAGVLSSFFLMGRTGASLQNYAEIDARARASLELFSQEARAAFDVTAATPTSVTFSIPDASPDRDALAYSVTYNFDASTGEFTRHGPPVGNPAGLVSTRSLVSGVKPVSGVSPFNYYRYINPITYPSGHGYVDGFTTNTASTTAEVKQIEVTFALHRQNITASPAASQVVSARYILRNK